LIVALWVLLILSLLIGSFAYDMQVEANITSFYRKRLKSQFVARAGLEYAKLFLAKSLTAKKEGPEDDEDEDTYVKAMNLQRGMGLSGVSQNVGQGKFTLDILPEAGRRNVNKLTDDDWEEILDQANVPQEKWAELIDCFNDWVDSDDAQRLNGAESDDPYYVQRGYKCKNGPLDTVDELLLIKGFTQSIVFGGPAEDPKAEPYLGIAQVLTTWGDGKVDVNDAVQKVLMTIPGMEDYDVQDIIDGRKGLDKQEGTKDDGFESVDEVISKLGVSGALAQKIRDRITTTAGGVYRIISIGEVQGVKSGIWCVMRLDQTGTTPLFWREEDMP